MGISFDKKATSDLVVKRKSKVAGKTGEDVVILENTKCTSPVTPSKSFFVDREGLISGVRRLVEILFEADSEIDFRQGDKVFVDSKEYNLSFFESGEFRNKFHYFFVIEKVN
jgi:hypothetical protein